MISQKDIGFLVRFICESDAIEGITDNRIVVREQLQRKYSRGHVGAILRLKESASRQDLLTHALVKQTQSLIVAEQHEKGEKEIPERYRGKWRDCQVSIGGRNGMTPSLIPSRMSVFIEETAQWQASCAELPVRQKIDGIARFHYEYEHIHPFIDGNGRSGRALVYYLYRFARLMPFVFTANDRYETYYQCFRDPEHMSKYFLERTTLGA